MRNLILILSLLLPSLSSFSQWRVGVTVGPDFNNYQVDNQYQYDWSYSTRIGLIAGIAGQYAFSDWFAVRAEVDYTHKNYRQHRNYPVSANNYYYRNDYIQVPALASFSFGGHRVRGIVNAGVYAGYWFHSSVSGSQGISGIAYPLDERVEFNNERDNRVCFGYVGGLGLEYRFTQNITGQIEARCYYDVTSQVRQYQHISDHRYNTTLGIHLTAFYTIPTKAPSDR